MNLDKIELTLDNPVWRKGFEEFLNKHHCWALRDVRTGKIVKTCDCYYKEKGARTK